MPKIIDLSARQVFDSRGTPTIEAEIKLDNGGHGCFITPSGASCGSKEALELRDGDHKKYAGKGVSLAISHVRGEIAKALIDNNFNSQSELDQKLITLDDTKNKSRLGANAILAVSGAFFRALADGEHKPLYASIRREEPYVMPMPLVNVINGGAHANNGLDIQEFMLVPVGAKSFSESLRFCAEVFYILKSHLAKLGFSTAVGDEGGFAPLLTSNEQALDILGEAVIKSGYKIGVDIAFALDVAATELFNTQSKRYEINKRKLEREELVNWYEKLVKDYSIGSIEDPFHEDDYDGFKALMTRIGAHTQIVGDDLFVTNEEYIKLGIEHKYANAVLIKMNQIGTISETLKAVELTQKSGLKAVISHRSGESEDTTIADLAVLTRAGQIKCGSMSRGERIAKYNRLLRIEEELGAQAIFQWAWAQ